VVGGDVRRPGQIGDGAGHLQDAVVGPRAQVQVGHRGLEQALRAVVQHAMLVDVLGAHARVAMDGMDALAFANRSRCTARDATTRSRIAAEGSPFSSDASCWYSIAGTSTWMSMRSSSGPEIRLR
jgi:hypothetical protein